MSPQFEDVGEVYNGQLIVKQGGRWGLANVGDWGPFCIPLKLTDKSDLRFLNKTLPPAEVTVGPYLQRNPSGIV